MSDLPLAQTASARLVDRLMSSLSFQISVDTDSIRQGLVVADAAIRAGITLVEMGTPLLKCEGVRNVVPIFRQRFPKALLLADMKTMDGGGFEALSVYEGGGNIIDFLALSGVASARAVCAVRDEFRAADSEVPRLAFADILVPHQGPAERAIDIARQMFEAGVDGVGLHLQLDARRADPALMQSGYLSDVARAVHGAVGHLGSVQVVGGLSIDQARALAADGLKAFVVSGNMGVADQGSRYGLPAEEIEALVRAFISLVQE
jgi:3-hexulose-6-phosphate synthase